MLVDKNITKQDSLLWIGKGDKDIMKKEFKHFTRSVNTKLHPMSSVWSVAKLFPGAKRNMDQQQPFFKVKNIDRLLLK